MRVVLFVTILSALTAEGCKTRSDSASTGADNGRRAGTPGSGAHVLQFELLGVDALALANLLTKAGVQVETTDSGFGDQQRWSAQRSRCRIGYQPSTFTGGGGTPHLEYVERCIMDVDLPAMDQKWPTLTGQDAKQFAQLLERGGIRPDVQSMPESKAWDSVRPLNCFIGRVLVTTQTVGQPQPMIQYVERCWVENETP